ncbi:MAG: serine/threonine protein kinase, partial [Candidatus Brocadiales bacterium]
VLKLGPDGTVEWQKTYGGDGWDEAESIQQTSDGGYIVVGGTGAFNTGDEMTFDLWVLKLGPDGTVEWQKTYGGFGKDVARSVQQTSDGGYIVAGYTGSFGPGGEGTFDLWVLKLRPDGSMDPSCDFMGNTNASGISSNALILDSSAIVRDSNASPQDSSATVKDTNVSANILCP